MAQPIRGGQGHRTLRADPEKEGQEGEDAGSRAGHQIGGTGQNQLEQGEEPGEDQEGKERFRHGNPLGEVFEAYFTTANLCRGLNAMAKF